MKKKEVLIWGTGIMTAKLLDEVDFASRGIEITGYIDNNQDVNIYRGGGGCIPTKYVNSP